MSLMKLCLLVLILGTCVLASCGEDYGPPRRPADRYYRSLVYEHGQWRQREDWSDPIYYQEPYARTDRGGLDQASP